MTVLISGVLCVLAGTILVVIGKLKGLELRVTRIETIFQTPPASRPTATGKVALIEEAMATRSAP